MPLKKPTRAELQLQQENDKLKTVCLRRELESKAGFVSRLQCLLSLRTQRIDHLTGTIDRLRDQNKRLDAEAERLAEMVRLSPEARSLT